MNDIFYWPKEFLDEVEGTTIERGALFWALGGPSFAYRTPETMIWIDPFFGGTPEGLGPNQYRAVPIPIKPDAVRLADIIISTHEHVDHCHKETLLPILSHTEAFCVAPQSSAKLMREFGIPDERINEVKAGDRLQYRDVTIDVYPSYDPNEAHAVTLVLTSGETKLFVSGDTWDGPALAEIGATHELDVALLAFGRTWYMDAEQVIAAARKLRPKVLVPFHWEFWRNHTGNLAQLFEVYHRERPDFEIQILLIGDSLRLLK